jgi:hypothetical protein
LRSKLFYFILCSIYFVSSSILFYFNNSFILFYILFRFIFAYFSLFFYVVYFSFPNPWELRQVSQRAGASRLAYRVTPPTRGRTGCVVFHIDLRNLVPAGAQQEKEEPSLEERSGSLSNCKPPPGSNCKPPPGSKYVEAEVNYLVYFGLFSFS